MTPALTRPDSSGSYSLMKTRQVTPMNHMNNVERNMVVEQATLLMDDTSSTVENQTIIIYLTILMMKFCSIKKIILLST
jgi:hypothetical protein